MISADDSPSPRDAAWMQSLAARLRTLYGFAEADAPFEPDEAALRHGWPRYEVRGELARGGMGSVHEVWDTSFDRTLAMKLPLGSEHAPDAARCRRVLEEAKLAGGLQHPGIVPIHDLGLDASGRPFFTMPLVSGRTLAEVFAAIHERTGEPTVADGLDVLIRVCDTVAYAHARGVVHRDLKPANVLVGSFGEVYVLDWGLAQEGSAAAPAAGTPAYMAPEQAAGGEVTAAADIYAAGVMARELCAAPAPVELDAIATKATAQDPGERYASIEELAADLRAFREQRVVKAYRTGAWAELSAWLRRNAVVAATAFGALAILVTIGLVFTLWLQEERDRSARAAVAARDRLQELLDLSVVERAKDLRERADRLWPAAPSRVPEMERWLRDAEELEPSLATLAARQPVSADGATTSEARWRARLLRAASEDLEAFFGGAGHGAGRLLEASVPAVRWRRDLARSLAERSIQSGEARAAWRAVARDVLADPRYGGLALAPQVGLLPIGRDGASGLFEFAHLQSGEPPARDAAGRLVLTAESGIVLVLLPGGSFAMGAGPSGAKNVDPHATEDNERPVHDVTLGAFFLGKHEITQAQWSRVTGRRPSNHDGRSAYVDAARAELHPVESVSWDDCRLVLPRLGLALPTEAQWEYAARAGTTTPWYVGAEATALIDPPAGNVADATCLRALGTRHWSCDDWLRDGFTMHAPVGTYRPNGFGLYDMIGNVHEWCRDEYVSYESPVSGPEGERHVPQAPGIAIYRGGAFDTVMLEARSANRAGSPPDRRYFSIGVRPARKIDACK